ncbi:flavin reductase family protein [Citricoccus sp. NPDC055426]|uniref:flavin reductase family protein n=1 Tax=Citricoccus sp. NPDC055426 TaxID=3155536 RepID=UPI00343DBF18
MTKPDPAALRPAFSRFPSGVAAIASVVDGTPTGLVASSFTVGVSMDPPLVSFAIQNTSSTWPTLRNARRLGISILGSEQATACRQLASKSGDRFEGLEIFENDLNALFIAGACLWLECEILNEVPAGDHAVVLLEVMSLREHPDQEPLVFHGSSFRRLHTEQIVN